ncbi:MAG: Wzz/FepE/Etk N-terminal domain-containing protein [Bacteroidota bacterium]
MKEKEINFVSIYITLLQYKTIAQKKWKQIIICGLVAGIIGVAYAWTVPKTYIAKLTFAIEEKSGTSMYSSLASQFGIDLSKGDGGAFKGENIIELFKSQSMIERALLTTYVFEGKEYLLIDRYLEVMKIDQEKVKYNFNKPRASYTRAEDSLLQVVGDDIIKNRLENEKPDKKLSFIEYRFRFTDELFAKVFLEHLAQVIKDTYVLQKTKKMKANIELLEMRIDSVRNELNTEMSGAASAQDQNQNAALARVKIPVLKRQMNVQLLTSLYGELTKNIELSKMALVKEEPLIEIIDTPTLPLKFEKKSRLMTGFLYGMVAVFLSILYYVGKNLYAEFYKLVEEEKSKHEG